MTTNPLRRDQLVAHRGYQKLYPENTLLAHREAIAAGALYLETDVLLSTDLQPVLYHDPGLRRISGQAGKISSLPLSTLTSIPAHEPRRLGRAFIEQTITPLVDFTELLTAHPQVSAYIEIKSEAIDFAGPGETLSALRNCLDSIAEQCYLISSHYEFIAYARLQGWAKCGLVLKRWKDISRPEVETIKADVIFCKYQKIPRRAALETIGAEIILYEINSPQLAAHWLQRGASKIETFDIGSMIKSQQSPVI